MYLNVLSPLFAIGAIAIAVFYKCALVKFKHIEKQVEQDRRELLAWQRELERDASVLRAIKKNSKKF